MNKKIFDIIIEKDEDGWLIADVPALKGCHTQGKNMTELIKNVKEVIELCLEVQKERKTNPCFNPRTYNRYSSCSNATKYVCISLRFS